MKIHKMVCIDQELIVFFQKQCSAREFSSLVNSLLSEHKRRLEDPFQGLSRQQLLLEQRKVDILIEAEKQIKKLEVEVL